MRWLLALCLWVAPASADMRDWAITGAALMQPTGRYDHGVLGDAVEWGGLELSVTPQGCAGTCIETERRTVTLPQDRVFEDLTARVVDVDDDQLPEVLVVQTDVRRGAMLTVYGVDGQVIAQTKPVGQSHRWLAPAGVGDFDGDGRTEIAYVDRPHLTRELVFVRLQGDALIEVARLPGLTNHRIGDRIISGGMRDCGLGAQVVLATGDWSRLVAARVVGVVDLGPYSAKSMRAALDCRL
jgi:hypothetical protein